MEKVRMGKEVSELETEVEELRGRVREVEIEGEINARKEKEIGEQKVRELMRELKAEEGQGVAGSRELD